MNQLTYIEMMELTCFSVIRDKESHKTDNIMKEDKIIESDYLAVVLDIKLDFSQGPKEITNCTPIQKSMTP